MSLIAIVYHSGYGHTARQAEAVARGALTNTGTEAVLIKPNVVLWQLGTNDAIQHVPVDVFEANVQSNLTALGTGDTAEATRLAGSIETPTPAPLRLSSVIESVSTPSNAVSASSGSETLTEV